MVTYTGRSTASSRLVLTDDTGALRRRPPRRRVGVGVVHGHHVVVDAAVGQQELGWHPADGTRAPQEPDPNGHRESDAARLRRRSRWPRCG
ncbi:MAG: hypothetical protein U5R31_00240 [Acidimicrobiia bacterium]|nr:hypothetical protein [Acidimicrobiia bacterium]